MDIFVRSIPLDCTDAQLKELFHAPFAACGITVYNCQKFRNQGLANITILDVPGGLDFLAKYGIPLDDRRKDSRPQIPLVLKGRHVLCSPSRNPPTELSLQSLKFETKRKAQRSAGHGHPNSDPHSGPPGGENRALNNFAIASFACGVWKYDNGRLTFVPYATQNTSGKLLLGARQAVLLLNSVIPGDTRGYRIDINYFNVDTVLTGAYDSPTVTFTLQCSPRSYEYATTSDGLAEAMASLRLGSKSKPKKTRLRGISKQHEAVAGTCFVYQVRLENFRDLPKAYSSLSHTRTIRSAVSFPASIRTPNTTLADQSTRLNFDLTTKYIALSFGLKYQAMRLAQNGRLAPDSVRSLLPIIADLSRDYGEAATIEAIRRLYLQIEPAGPEKHSDDYSQDTMSMLLRDHACAYESYKAHSAYDLANRHSHIVLVHKIQVTPAGVYLQGPEPEITNRVLRKYPEHIDHFLRVSFMDEDGEAVRYDPKADQKVIYEGRFKAFMDGSFIIAGHGFSFLGFSHSSLRSQTCWFMAPFVYDSHAMFAPIVIKQLGDFSSIKSAARCAARIGQAFTDTTGTVRIEPSMLSRLPDIKRNGRVFSDGVGTISRSLLERVWRQYGTRRALKPTILQIRYAGVKGVVSLDSRIPEEMLTIRGSMDKFPGSLSNTVEVCGAAFRPLPMVLNWQFIKIMEDLGVPLESFMNLQATAVQRLREITQFTINAALFLKESQTSKAAQLPHFLEYLSDIGLDYHNDAFLSSVVEMATITKLRDIKYRGRIPVKQGVTLYGIMDETGYLQEGEIYVVTEDPPNRPQSVLTGGKVIVTRSSALHPGDIRTVKAVNIPNDSPLNQLSNCVVFSQRGARDLPSQLSGGDLDGDLYNVIFDATLMPRYEDVTPADYPRVAAKELNRAVESKDMSDFFVKFMETDQLGQICTLHQQIADQKDLGVFDDDCLKLAEMASTAVDFSKSGIPVDINELPRSQRFRPDFMAPSPRAVIASGGIKVLDDDHDEAPHNDPVAELDPDSGPMRYYESTRVLGHLYRAIDEQQFLSDMHRQNHHLGNGTENTLMKNLWDYIQRHNLLVQWEHNRALARQIKEGYEASLQQVLHEYEPSPRSPVTEAELFAGTILGRAGGASTKRLREITTTMRDRSEEILEFTISRIIDGDYDDNDRNDEALPRSIACLAIGMQEDGLWDRKLGYLESWKYIAAGVCLREMKRWRMGSGSSGYVMLPRV